MRLMDAVPNSEKFRVVPNLGDCALTIMSYWSPWRHGSNDTTLTVSTFSEGYFPVLPWSKCTLQTGAQSQVMNLAKRSLGPSEMFDVLATDDLDELDAEIMEDFEEDSALAAAFELDLGAGKFELHAPRAYLTWLTKVSMSYKTCPFYES